jgi:actin
MDFIIIDVGTGITKAGVNGNDMPTHVFPSIVNGSYVGKDAIKKGGLQRPVLERGHWSSPENIQKMFKYLYKSEPNLNATEHGVLLADIPTASKSDREKITRLLFETYDVPSLYLGRTDVLSTVSAGKLSGAVLESGHGVTHASVSLTQSL